MERRRARQNLLLDGDIVSGLDKFADLEDKVHRTIERIQLEREERAALEQELVEARRESSRLAAEKERLSLRLERLLTERDAMKLKVEAMLDAIAVISPEAAETLKK